MTRVAVQTYRVFVVDIDPDEFGLPADITPEALALALNDCPDSWEYLPGRSETEGEVDAGYGWRAPETWEVGS